MNKNKCTKTSKFLSYILRHHPESADVTLDASGWVAIDELIRGCTQKGRSLTRSEIDEVVETNTKKRFAISEDGTRIRASQGHSLEINLGYEPIKPPDTLFHGTFQKALPSIRSQGLLKMNRHHVHLSSNKETALVVGGRRGNPIVLTVDSGAMYLQGLNFYCSANNVWLTDAVLPEFIFGLS